MAIRDIILDTHPNSSDGISSVTYVPNYSIAGLNESSFLLELLIVILSEQPIVHNDDKGNILSQDITLDPLTAEGDTEVQMRLGNDVYIICLNIGGHSRTKSVTIRAVKCAACNTFGLLESEISLYAGKDLCDENAELQDEAFGMRTDVLDIHINSLDLSPFLDEKRRVKEFVKQHGYCLGPECGALPEQLRPWMNTSHMNDGNIF